MRCDDSINRTSPRTIRPQWVSQFDSSNSARRFPHLERALQRVEFKAVQRFLEVTGDLTRLFGQKTGGYQARILLP